MQCAWCIFWNGMIDGYCLYYQLCWNSWFIMMVMKWELWTKDYSKSSLFLIHPANECIWPQLTSHTSWFNPSIKHHNLYMHLKFCISDRIWANCGLKHVSPECDRRNCEHSSYIDHWVLCWGVECTAVHNGNRRISLMHFLRKSMHEHHGFEVWPGLGQRVWDLQKNQRETCSMRVGECCVGPTDPWLLSLYKDTYVRSTGGLNWVMGCLWCEGVESETAGEDCGIRCLEGGQYVCV